MMLIHKLILGPIATNCYLVVDQQTKQAVIIDPGWEGERIFAQVLKQGLKITRIWYTHAHFDHFSGTAELVRRLEYIPSIALHYADFKFWQRGGGSSTFGVNLDPGPRPGCNLADMESLPLGNYSFKVISAPGHSPGSCLFYCASENAVFTGDLIFYRSVGRTELPGGNWVALETSIRKHVYTLPPETRIFPGHGPETTVGEEKEQNPYVHY